MVEMKNMQVVKFKKTKTTFGLIATIAQAL